MKELNIKELNMNPFELQNTWALLSAKDGNDYNAMTVSWGSFGILWEKPVVTLYIRPQRYTKKLLDNNDYYTLSFFDKEHKKDLGILGSISKNTDPNKMEKVSLTKVEDGNIVYFKEAKLVLVLKKIYVNQMNKDGIKSESVIDKMYPNGDYSYCYIGEIEKVFERE